MKRNTIRYLIMILLLPVALFLTNNMFFLGLFVLGILFLPLLRLLLTYEAQHMTLTLSAPSSRILGQEITCSIQLANSSALIVSGVIDLSLSTTNAMSKKVQRSNLRLALMDTSHQFDHVIQPSSCGNLTCQIRKAALTDLFGLCSVPLTLPQAVVTTIYPDAQPIELIPRLASQLSTTSGEKIQNHRGNDKSEVYSLKAYKPGDDIRSIHWKMSSKLNHPVVREASATIHYHTLILCDVVRMRQHKEIEDAVLNAAVRLTASLGRTFTEQSIGYEFSVNTTQSFEPFLITNQTEYLDALRTWMGISFSEHDSEGLQLLLNSQNELPFTRLFYITDGSCPEEIAQLRDTLDTTVFCLSTNASQITETTQPHCSIITLPLNLSEDAPLQLQF